AALRCYTVWVPITLTATGKAPNSCPGYSDACAVVVGHDSGVMSRAPTSRSVVRPTARATENQCQSLLLLRRRLQCDHVPHGEDPTICCCSALLFHCFFK
ncbi:hypothetical protein FQN60_015160, partial [Etheostoma spectabile]